MAKGLDDLIQKLNRIENHLAEEIAPQINGLLKESVHQSLIDWYNDYPNGDYVRTQNLMSIVRSAKTSGKGNALRLSVDSGYMSNYTGWNGGIYSNTYSIPNNGIETYKGQRLNASIAFDFMFMNGEHGHGKWFKYQSIPPYLSVNSDITNMFNGQANVIINNTIGKILKG